MQISIKLYLNLTFLTANDVITVLSKCHQTHKNVVVQIMYMYQFVKRIVIT